MMAALAAGEPPPPFYIGNKLVFPMEDDEGWVLPVSRFKSAKISTIQTYGTYHAVAAPVDNFPSPPIIAAMSRTALKRRQLHRLSATRAASPHWMHQPTNTRPAPFFLRSSATVPSTAEESVQHQCCCGKNDPNLSRVQPPPAASLLTMIHPTIQPRSHQNTSLLISPQFELRSRQIWTTWIGVSRRR